MERLKLRCCFNQPFGRVVLDVAHGDGWTGLRKGCLLRGNEFATDRVIIIIIIIFFWVK